MQFMSTSAADDALVKIVDTMMQIQKYFMNTMKFY